MWSTYPQTHTLLNVSQLYIFEDNEAGIKMTIKRRSPTMRHVSRTHRVAHDRLFDRITLETKIQIKYVDTKIPHADMLTKESFSRDEWNHFLRSFNIINFLFDLIGKQSAMSKMYTEHLTVRTHAHIFLVHSSCVTDVWLQGWTIQCVCAKVIPSLCHVSFGCSISFVPCNLLFTNLFSDATFRLVHPAEWNQKTPSAMGWNVWPSGQSDPRHKREVRMRFPVKVHQRFPAKARPINLILHSPWSARKNSSQNFGYPVNPANDNWHKETCADHSKSRSRTFSSEATDNAQSSDSWKQYNQEEASHSTSTRKLVQAGTPRMEFQK